MLKVGQFDTGTPNDTQSKGHIKASPVDTSALNEARIQ